MHRIVQRPSKGDPFAVRARRDVADRTLDVGDFGHLAARGRDRVQIGVAAVVVRLVHAIRGEVNARSVRTPHRIVFAEIAARQLLRLRRFARSLGHFECPDVHRACRIEIARAVRPIHRLIDDSHVADVFLRFFLFFDILRLRAGSERDRAAGWRPGDRVDRARE